MVKECQNDEDERRTTTSAMRAKQIFKGTCFFWFYNSMLSRVTQIYTVLVDIDEFRMFW